MRPTGAGAVGPPRRQQVLDAVPPASGAVVMGSGILCVDLFSVGQPVEAAILLWFAAGTWLFLAAVLALRVLYEPGRIAREARSPAALTGVVGTGVLGTAFAVHDYYPVAAVMLGLAGVSWALLLTPVLSHWETPVARGVLPPYRGHGRSRGAWRNPGRQERRGLAAHRRQRRVDPGPGLLHRHGHAFCSAPVADRPRGSMGRRRGAGHLHSGLRQDHQGRRCPGLAYLDARILRRCRVWSFGAGPCSG